MDINKVLTKKVIFFSSMIIHALVLVLVFFNGSFLRSMKNISYSLSNVQSAFSSASRYVSIINGFYYLLLALSIVVAALAFTYTIKKNKKEYVIILVGVVNIFSALLIVLSLPGLAAQREVFNLLGSESIYRTASKLTALTTNGSYTLADRLLKIHNLFNIFALVGSVVFLLIANKTIKTPKYVFDFNENGNNDKFNEAYTSYTNPEYTNVQYTNPEYTNTMDNTSVENTPKTPFFKTKNGIIALVVAALVVVSGLGYFIFNSLNTTKIDLGSNIQVTFSGNSGSGYTSSYRVTNNVDYDKSNADIASFINSVTYTFSKNSNLSNGDKVTVTAVYSNETAKRLKLKVTNVTKTVTVSGLRELGSII